MCASAVNDQNLLELVQTWIPNPVYGDMLYHLPYTNSKDFGGVKFPTVLYIHHPVHYVVNTHHHFDHSGGLRTYVAQGATIVTHQANREYYEQVHFNPAPRTLQPDRFATFYPYFVGGRRPLPMETVNQKYVLSAGVRTIDLYPVQGRNHAATMLIAYFPKEKILVNADLYSPPAQGAPTPAPNANMTTLQQNIQRLKLDVAQHVPIYGQPGPMSQFTQIVGR